MPYVRTRLGRWFYEESGRSRSEGDPAIVLNHSLLWDGGMFAAQLGPLSALGRVINFDGPGHGRSEPPPRFSLEDHADAMTDAFAELKIQRAVMVGLSWGAMVGMRMGLQHPSRVAAMVLMSTSADKERTFQVVRDRLSTAFVRRVGIPRWLFDSEIAPRMFAPQTIRSRPDLVDDLARRLNGFSRDGVARAALAVVVHRTRVLDRLGSIKVPTLVLWGREDGSFPVSFGEAIAAKISGSRLSVIEGAGHALAVERPEAVNAELVPFVAAQMSKGPAAQVRIG